MEHKKLIDSLEHISDSYIEEALNMPVRQSHPEKSGARASSGRLYIRVAGAAAILFAGIGMLYAIHSALPASQSTDKISDPTKTASSKDTIFTPLRVVAYAAETADGSSDKGTELQADVPTTLSKYSALMSSVPAMPFSFSYDEKTEGETIRFVISADDMGMMQKYEVGETWKLTEEASTLECQEDEKVYWMPTGDFQSKTPEERDEDGDKKTEKSDDMDVFFSDSINAEDLGADSAITVQVYSGQKLLETRYIGISYDDIYYTATLKLNVTSDTEDFGDFTIESKSYEYEDEETRENIRKKLIEKAKREAEKNGGTVQGGSQEGVPSSEEDEYDIEIQSSPSAEVTKIPPDYDQSKLEYGYPTKEYFIEKEYHKK